MYRYLFVALAAVITTYTYLTYNNNNADKLEYVTVEAPKIEIVISTPAPEPRAVLDYTQLECLALNIYHEARGESVPGQIAVSQVVMNRVKSSRFPNSVCDVIYQAVHSRWWMETHGRLVPVKYQCQFTWYCDGRSDRPRDMDAWGQALSVAASVMRNEYNDLTHGALWYHANYVNPSWRYHFKQTATIGDHVFYTAGNI